MTRTLQRFLQIANEILNRPVFRPCDNTQGPPVMRDRLQSDRPEQHLGRHMVNVGYERHTHPGADWLVLQAQAVRMPAGPVTENESPGNRHQKSRRQD